jgi:hypothetical protein
MRENGRQSIGYFTRRELSAGALAFGAMGKAGGLEKSKGISRWQRRISDEIPRRRVGYYVDL